MLLKSANGMNKNLSYNFMLQTFISLNIYNENNFHKDDYIAKLEMCYSYLVNWGLTTSFIPERTTRLIEAYIFATI